MTQHTPAPWTARFDGELWTIEANDGASCIATGASWFGKQQPGEANARLIAAAPDLLDALRDMMALYFSASMNPNMELVHKAQAAIAKAKSRA